MLVWDASLRIAVHRIGSEVFTLFTNRKQGRS